VHRRRRKDRGLHSVDVEGLYDGAGHSGQGCEATTIIGFQNDAAGRNLSVLSDVYKSESDTNQRNQAIGVLSVAFGGKNPVTGRQVMDGVPVSGVLAVMATAGLSDDSASGFATLDYRRRAGSAAVLSP